MNCTKRTIEICGEALAKVYEYQLAYKLKHNRHITFERAVNHLLINGNEQESFISLSKTDNDK